MPTTDLILDTYTPYDFKRGVGGTVYRRGWMAPSWVGDERRRLEAYKLLASYLLNASRNYLNTQDEEVRSSRREYGDARLLVKTVVAYLLGDDVTVFSDDATTADIEWAIEWAKKERVVRKVFSMEKNAVGYGDAVAEITWDATKDRPAVAVYDPGFYFPDIDSIVGDYPTTVCFAWEFECRDDNSVRQRYVRRKRYQLITTEDPRNYPWNANPVFQTVIVSDATWRLEDLRTTEVQTFDEAKATYAVNADGEEVRNLDLEIDYLPIVHMPNTVAESDDDHFGDSLLAYVLQIMDDLQNSDTDLEAAAGIVGFPPLASDGDLQHDDDDGRITSYGPGTVFSGKLSVMDTSHSLDALIKYCNHLLKRLLTNSQVAAAAVGAIKPNEISSGIELRLHFNPMERMIREMRLVRDEKYPLIFKFAHRFAMKAGQVPISPDEPLITLKPGSFITSDLAAVVNEVATAVGAKIMSLETGVQMLIDAGVPATTITEEIKRIESRDFGDAKVLRELGSRLAAFEFLGRTDPGDTPAPESVPRPPGPSDPPTP